MDIKYLQKIFLPTTLKILFSIILKIGDYKVRLLKKKKHKKTCVNFYIEVNLTNLKL